MAWYNASWLYRFKITSDQTKVDEAIDNLVFDLANAPAAFWTHVNTSDGRDIRVTLADEVTEVAREISGFYGGSQVGSLFFKATGLSASVNTDYYVYYGNGGASEPAAGSTYGKNNVWTSYVCVFHLDEPSGNVTCSKSSTTGTNTGVTLDVAGKLRTGGTWDSTDKITCGDAFDITAASLTISAWVNPNSTAANYFVLAKCDPDYKNGYALWLSSGYMLLQIGDATGFDQKGVAPTTYAAGSLQLMHATWDSSFIARMYLNGVLKGADSAGTKTPTNGAGTFTIGQLSDFASETFQGVLDEVRVSTSVRSGNWISTEYNNQNAPSTFWTTGAETQDAVVSTALTWLPRQMILRGPRGLMTPSGPVPPTRPEP